jgi:uncharacterized protein (TIGR02145 family)
MRNLIPILLAVVVLSSGCDCDGYSCTSEGCYADDDSPQYLTLEDCLSVCDEIDSNSAVFETCGDDIGHEGYDYSTVQIGEQCWFAENCRYLPEVSPSSEESSTDPYYYVYDYEGTYVAAAQATANYETYGVLYNWPAVMTEDICPSGWHIPSDGEFTQLTDFLGGESVAGYAMKSTTGWNNEGNGTNSSGFNGLPGGYRYSGGFMVNGSNGYWWSASESGSYSWLRQLFDDADSVVRSNSSGYDGFSARCVRD